MKVQDYSKLVESFDHFYMMTEDYQKWLQGQRDEFLVERYKNETAEHRRSYEKYLLTKRQTFKNMGEL